MTGAQKFLALFGVLLMIAAASAAPVTYQVEHPGPGAPLVETTHCPLWRDADVCAADAMRRQYPHELFLLERREAHLDAGRLGLWWGGIVGATLLLMVLAAPRRASTPTA